MDQQINRISFNKGYTENGFDEKVFHLHLRIVNICPGTKALLFLYIFEQIRFSHLYIHLCYTHILSIASISFSHIRLQYGDAQSDNL